MKRSRLALWIVLLLALYALSALFAAPAPQVSQPAGTSYSAAPNGAMALFQLLAQKPAAGAVHLRLEPAALAKWPATPKNLLIIEPQQDDSTRTTDQWLQLARRGYRVIELTDHRTPLVAALGLQWHAARLAPPGVRSGAARADTAQNRARQRTILLSGAATQLSFVPPGRAPQTSGTTRWHVSSLPQAPTLTGWRKTDGRWMLSPEGRHPSVVGVTRRIGSGSVTVLTVPSIAYNRAIAGQDNLGVLLFLLKPWLYSTGFAETVHGYALVPGILPLLGPWANFALVLIASSIVLYIWSRGRRLGAVAEEETAPPPANLALVTALARHYRKRGDYRELLENLHHLAAHRRASREPPASQRADDGERADGSPLRAHAYLRKARDVLSRLSQDGHDIGSPPPTE